MTRCSRSQIFALRKKGSFPQPIKLSPRKIVWRQSTIEEHMQRQQVA
ncbi:helix-turn-helix transcriptional regulator [Pseudoalteromonas rubra]